MAKKKLQAATSVTPQSENPRQKCPKGCGLSYRWPSDFEEHLRVGCVVESGKGETFSSKDAEEEN